MSSKVSGVRTLVSDNSISFLVLGEGEYFSCVLPRRDAPFFVEALRRLTSEAGEKEEESQLETSEMQVFIKNMEIAVCIEGTSKENSSRFRMILEKDNVLLLIQQLDEICEDDELLTGSGFSWIPSYTAAEEIS